jgi:septum formation protein
VGRLILASQSPRRREILEKYSIELEICKSESEEVIRTDEKPEQIAMGLAFQKAYEVANKYEEDIVLGADTIVVLNEEVLGKPKNYEDAKLMLNKLSGKKHSVITGFCLINLSTGKKHVDYVETEVYFKDLTDAKIQRYLETKEYADKAGSYGIQGLGELLVERINGSYSNVVGLPIEKIAEVLEKFYDFYLI